MNREKLIEDLDYVEQKLIELAGPGYVNTASNRRTRASFEILYDILTYILKRERKVDGSTKKDLPIQSDGH